MKAYALKKGRKYWSGEEWGDEYVSLTGAHLFKNKKDAEFFTKIGDKVVKVEIHEVKE